MDKVGRSQSTTILKKGKKKHAKDELDRLKQAEKKKRRLEKALAASAAIRSELEKKKQKKFEEQQRLDKEGAAIAESVALHVLGEDTDEPYLNDHGTYNPWNHSRNIGLYMGCATDLYGSACRWNVPGMHVRNLQGPYYGGSSPGVDMSVGLVAAQAVSTLHIGEEDGEQFAGTGASFFNGMIGNCNLGARVDLYQEIIAIDDLYQEYGLNH